MLCTSGCGIRPGAPIVTHATEGTVQLMGVAAGSAPCSRRSMRNRLNKEPPLYIDVYPYVSWIINFVTANILPRPYPEHFKLVDGGSSKYTNLKLLQRQIFLNNYSSKFHRVNSILN